MATSFKAIATATLTSTATSITFSSIPQTYTHLWIMGQAGTTATDAPAIYARPNNITSSSYDYANIYVDSGGITQRNALNTDRSLGLLDMTDSTANSSNTGFEIVYPLYKGGLGNNTYLFNANSQRTATSVSNQASWGVSNVNDTNAITSIVFSLQGSGTRSFAAGTKITLYGLD